MNSHRVVLDNLSRLQFIFVFCKLYAIDESLRRRQLNWTHWWIPAFSGQSARGHSNIGLMSRTVISYVNRVVKLGRNAAESHRLMIVWLNVIGTWLHRANVIRLMWDGIIWTVFFLIWRHYKKKLFVVKSSIASALALRTFFICNK